MNAHEKEVYSLVYRAWQLASWDAHRRYDAWQTANGRLDLTADKWHRVQLKWMESDPEWAEYVMLARLMG